MSRPINRQTRSASPLCDADVFLHRDQDNAHKPGNAYAQGRERQSGAPVRALVVDDCQDSRRVATRVLSELGFEILEAESGEAALECLADHDRAFDLMLVDWSMSVMDGLTLVRRVRAAPANADMTILMLSSESDPKRLANSLLAGADDYLTKPIDERTLRAKLELIGISAGRG